MPPKFSAPINDGGLAFPHDERDSNGQFRQHFGMTLRDYFAAKALAGMDLKNDGEYPIFSDGSHAERDSQWAAIAAYRIADAMIAARGGAK